MPSLAGPVEDRPDTGRAFALAAFRPVGDAVAVVILPLAADWPTWTPEQAQAVGLLCRACGHDLRADGPDRRTAFQVGPDTATGALSLECGPCAHPERGGGSTAGG